MGTILWQNMSVKQQNWLPSWKMAANVLYLINDPRGINIPNLVLVSTFERLLQLSAPLLAL